MTLQTAKAKSLEVLMEELCVLLYRVLGSEAETDTACKIQDLIVEMTAIRTAMERHTEVLAQAAATIKTAQQQAQKQQILFEEVAAISQDISWIREQLSQDPFVP
tara:strand:+ start:697 stop:1011 length:315 start_codon:yes stop_codon:yes gene_type:complete